MSVKKAVVKKKGTFTDANLQLAISEVRENRSSLRQAALKHSIPRSTLSRYLQNIASDPGDIKHFSKKSMITMQVDRPNVM